MKSNIGINNKLSFIVLVVKIHVHVTKQPWNLQHQLREYCWLDVDVLASIVKKFRDTHLNFGNDISNVNNWKPVSIDPFNYCTQSQVAMNFFLAGKEPHTTAAISTIKHRQNFSAISIAWLEQMSKL